MKILAREFRNRADLEREAKRYEDQADVVIEGTRAELRLFGLSDRNTVWGLPVVITDDPTPPGKQHIAPDRGGFGKRGKILGK